MLVARRDPPFHTDADDVAPVNLGVYPAAKASTFTRVVAAIQMVGSLLAVPVGIASAYSFYRANFSPEITCQSLRSGIVAMLDKSVDAATRRILVRRDVETFEKTCGAVDPDATAAFKTLLAGEKTAAPAAVLPVVPKVQRSETVTKEPVRKAEPQPQVPAKPPVTAAAPVVVEPARRDKNRGCGRDGRFGRHLGLRLGLADRLLRHRFAAFELSGPRTGPQREPPSFRPRGAS